MTLSLVKITACMSALIMLTASCGGGATSSAPVQVIAVNAPSGKTYYGLSNIPDAEPQSLGGAVLASKRSDGEYAVRSATGAIDRGAGTYRVSDGVYTLNSTGTVDASTTLITDGMGGKLLKTVGLGDGYEFMQTFEGTYTVGAETYDITLVAGVPTEIADIPTTQTANFTGKANLTVVTENAFTRVYSNGTASVQVDFATRRVALDMNSFTVTNRSGQSFSGPFDSMQITDMVLAGGRFSGGDVVFKTGNQTVTPLGPQTTNSSQGTLFGFDDSTGKPDEAGGVVLVESTTGQVTGAFATD